MEAAVIALLFCISCSSNNTGKHRISSSTDSLTASQGDTLESYPVPNTLLLLPKDPKPGEPFRIVATGNKNIRKATISVDGGGGVLESVSDRSGEQIPFWRIFEFTGAPEGTFKATIIWSRTEKTDLEFRINSTKKNQSSGAVWNTLRGWDRGSEAIYSAWINSLFQGYGEDASWPALHEVIQNREHNFLYNYLSLDEDNPKGTNRLIMQPDCADNPFFLRAYFAWKLGLPFGYHICDRGNMEHSPKPGVWITNETQVRRMDPVMSFNMFLRRIMNDVQSGTARTALDDDNSDYYPVALERRSLLPGTVYADPYGHTLVLVGWVQQTGHHTGLLLAADAQPDGTVGIKRFWKGNFLFNTSGVIGEPGFKAFRPVSFHNNELIPLRNRDLNGSACLVPFSLQQKRMKSEVFYHTMERLINPEPLDPETALLDLIDALHEQLVVRITSVANGEAYQKTHPGSVIPMPGNAAGLFQAGGQWENFSTPNRDLRLLIAMDAVLNFPEIASASPGDFKTSDIGTKDEIKMKLQGLLDKKVSEISISYTRTNGSVQNLTLAEILARRDAFEMAYNPNDGIEIRWGAPENSEERASCRRHAPSYQLETMRAVRTWFHKRLHPPT